MTQAAGAGQVASGIATYGNQATGRVVGRALDTRPTIKVHAGQLCNVLLTKELKFPRCGNDAPPRRDRLRTRRPCGATRARVLAAGSAPCRGVEARAAASRGAGAG